MAAVCEAASGLGRHAVWQGRDDRHREAPCNLWCAAHSGRRLPAEHGGRRPRLEPEPDPRRPRRGRGPGLRPGRLPGAGHHRLPARGPAPQARLHRRQPGRPAEGGCPYRAVRGGGRLRGLGPRPAQRRRRLRRGVGAGRLPQAPPPQLRRVRRAALLRAQPRQGRAVRHRRGAGRRRRLRGRLVARRPYRRPGRRRGRAHRQPERLALPRRAPGRAGADAGHPGRRRLLRARLREPRRRPGRARLRRGVSGPRPQRAGGGPSPAVPRGDDGRRHRGEARLPQAAPRPTGPGVRRAAAGGVRERRADRES